MHSLMEWIVFRKEIHRIGICVHTYKCVHLFPFSTSQTSSNEQPCAPKNKSKAMSSELIN